MSKTVVHMIGQAHLDPVWLWRWTEGRAEALATSQSAVDRLAEYPDFHFARGESQVYGWIEDENPALFRRIRSLIDEGRWHVVNGMVIQPDMNIPQGESFVRQVLLGKAYMREHLGVEPKVAYCVDSFGHNGALPQILRKCGFDAYVFMRPGPHEKELPAEVFWWQAADGSRILTYRIAAAYTTRTTHHEQHIEAALQAKPPSLSHTMCFFGVGNHGGGPTKSQIEDVQAIAASRDDVEIRFSWPDAYFDAIAGETGELPVVREELQYHAVGCYSAVSALEARPPPGGRQLAAGRAHGLPGGSVGGSPGPAAAPARRCGRSFASTNSTTRWAAPRSRRQRTTPSAPWTASPPLRSRQAMMPGAPSPRTSIRAWTRAAPAARWSSSTHSPGPCSNTSSMSRGRTGSRGATARGAWRTTTASPCPIR